MILSKMPKILQRICFYRWMMTLKKQSVIFIVIFFPLVIFSDGPRFEFEGRYWYPTLSMYIHLDEIDTDNDDINELIEDVLGTRFDIKEELGIRDQNYPEGRITWHTGSRSRIRFSYLKFLLRGDTDLKRDVRYDGHRFELGARIKTDIDMKYFRLAWIWQFIDYDEGLFQFGTVLEAKGFWIDAKIEAPEFNETGEGDVYFGFPTLGFAVDLNPNAMVNAFAEISGVYAFKFGHFYDFEAGVKFAPTERITLTGGYRTFELKPQYEDEYLRFRISGPFLGASMRF